MSFKANNTQIRGVKVDEPTLPSNSEEVNIQLNKEELELLLVTIKNSLFKGEYVELLYNLTLKLQTSYLHLNKK